MNDDLKTTVTFFLTSLCLGSLIQKLGHMDLMNVDDKDIYQSANDLLQMFPTPPDSPTNNPHHQVYTEADDLLTVK